MSRTLSWSTVGSVWWYLPSMTVAKTRPFMTFPKRSAGVWLSYGASSASNLQPRMGSTANQIHCVLVIHGQNLWGTAAQVVKSPTCKYSRCKHTFGCVPITLVSMRVTQACYCSF
uniref:Putative secreted protein n=1 Tax=Ixodes ricinus TaxID=34613 RepID=A0A6B0UL61_IXORI